MNTEIHITEISKYKVKQHIITKYRNTKWGYTEIPITKDNNTKTEIQLEEVQ